VPPGLGPFGDLGKSGTHRPTHAVVGDQSPCGPTFCTGGVGGLAAGFNAPNWAAWGGQGRGARAGGRVTTLRLEAGLGPSHPQVSLKGGRGPRGPLGAGVTPAPRALGLLTVAPPRSWPRSLSGGDSPGARPKGAPACGPKASAAGPPSRDRAGGRGSSGVNPSAVPAPPRPVPPASPLCLPSSLAAGLAPSVTRVGGGAGSAPAAILALGSLGRGGAREALLREGEDPTGFSGRGRLGGCRCGGCQTQSQARSAGAPASVPVLPAG
jgi:hypothetical protein